MVASGRGRDGAERVAIVGLGTVGLPTAVAFARAGVPTVGADVAPDVVAAISHGRSPVPDVASDDEVAECVATGMLRATRDAVSAAAEADLVLLSVPTRIDAGRRPDLSALTSAVAAVGRGLRRGAVVVTESTLFPGCTEGLLLPILERESGLVAGRDFGVAHCPARASPGDAERSAVAAPRVLGALDEDTYVRVRAAYLRALGVPVHRARDIRTAEAAKLLEVTQRDVNLALVNEFALLCPDLGLDVHEVLAAASSAHGFVRLAPGPGVGGEGLSVHPWYLVEEARRHGHEPRLVVAARDVNEGATERLAEEVFGALARAPPERAKAAVLGLAYKGGVDDVRASPALRLVAALRTRLAVVATHDPRVDPERARKATGLPNVPLHEAVQGAHAVVLATDHPEFALLDWEDVARRVAPGAAILDARNLVRSATLRALGLRAWGLGRGWSA